MKPSTITLVLSCLSAWVIVAVIAAWLWSLMKRAQPRDEEVMYRTQIGDVLVTPGVLKIERRCEDPCPDCQYGEPCEKCLGVKA